MSLSSKLLYRMYRVRHKKIAPGVFGSFLSNDVEFKGEILYTSVDSVYVHTGINIV